MMNAKHLSMVGKWQFEKDINFEAYLREIGMNAVKRKLAILSKPKLSVQIVGEVWTTKVESLLKTKEWTFKIGEPFKAETVDGRSFMVTVTLGENGNVTEIQENVDGDKSVVSEITRFVNDKDQLIAICRANRVEAQRFYSRIKE